MRRTLVAAGFIVWVLIAVSPLWGQDNNTARLAGDLQRLEQRVQELEELVRALQLRLEQRQAPDEGEADDPPPPSASTGSEPAAQVIADPGPPEDPGTLRAYWKEGLRLDSADGAFQLKIGGRIMNDWSYYSGIDDPVESILGQLRDGTEFRRARIGVSGTIHDRLEYKAEYDFAGSVTDFGATGAVLTDVYIGLLELPAVGTLRIGHQKEPFGLEQLTSSRHLTFLERALPDVFTPSRNTGVMIHNTGLNQRLNWAIGSFRESDAKGAGFGDRNYNLTARVTGLPWYAGDGRRLFHLGVAYSHRNSPIGLLRFRERPESHLAPRFVDTGFFDATSYDLLGLEGAIVNGPFSIQGEYMRTFTNTPTGEDPSFSGFYLQTSFFLTGEHRPYSHSSGAFDRVRPRSDLFGEARGAGAWELAGRYSYLDLNDQGIDGGRLNNLTLGLNWYLNPNTRFMWNYVFSNLDGVGDANILQTRFQVDF